MNGGGFSSNFLSSDLIPEDHLIRPKTGGEEPPQPLGLGSGGLDTGVRQALARNFAKKVANSKKINEEAKESVT
jgi:hypothetical protein